jgi:hypothetical protein
VDYANVLRKAWKATWRYWALWVFGIILALTTASWSAATLYDLGGERQDRWEDRGITITTMPGETFGEAFQRTMRAEIDRANRELDQLLAEELHIHVKSNVIVIAVVLLIMVTVAVVVSRVARYVSEVALIRMVSETGTTGERHSVWRGFRLGWSRSAWRIFVINLLLGILAVVTDLGLFALILSPLPLWVNGGEIVISVFAVLTAGSILIAIVPMIALGVVLAVTKRLAWRACAVEGLGVVASIRRGWAIMGRQMKDVGLIWLITLAVGWTWRLAMVPIVLLLLGGGVMLGGLPAVLVGEIASQGMSGDVPVFIAIAVGIAIFLFVMIAPLILLGGLREVFLSSIWTLTYHELGPTEALERERVPGPGASGLEAAPAA